MLGWPDCGWTGVFGEVRSANNLPLRGIQLRVWNGDFSWASDIVTTNEDGEYAIKLADGPVEGRWFVQVLANGPDKGYMRGFETSLGCKNGLQRIQMNWRRAW